MHQGTQSASPVLLMKAALQSFAATFLPRDVNFVMHLAFFTTIRYNRMDY